MIAGFSHIGPGVYQKWDPVMLIRTTVTFTGKGEKKIMHVRREQPDWVGKVIIDDNVARQNDFAGYSKMDGGYHGARIPLPMWGQIMTACGHSQGEYDQKKFKRILNDPDYAKLRTVPGKI